MFNIFRFIIFIIYIIICFFIAFFVPFITHNDSIIRLIYIIFNYLCGYNKPIVRDYRKFKHDDPIVLFQHTNLIDPVLLIPVLGKLSVIVNISYLSGLPRKMLHRLMSSHNTIFIEKDKKNNLKIITDFIAANPKAVIAIAPSGGHSKYENRIGDSFSTGAFALGKAVSPVLIRYSDDKATWYKNETEFRGTFEWLFQCFMRKHADVEVLLMEEIAPLANGKETPKEYAERVRLAMIEFDKAHPPCFK